jgi:O-antigen/teichoic acid export membrane protein
MQNVYQLFRQKAGRFRSDQLLNNIFWNSIGRFGSAGLNLLITLFLMDVLEVEDYGEYVVFFSIYSTVPFFFEFGLNASFIALGAKFRSEGHESYNELVSTIFTLKLIILMIVVAVLPIAFLTGIIQKKIIILILLGAVLGFWDFLTSVFKTNQKFKTLAWLLPLRNLLVLLVILVMYFAMNVETWEPYLYVVMLAPLALSLIIYVLYFREISLRIYPDRVRETFALSKWLALFTLVTAVHSRADLYLLEYFSERGVIAAKETGIFSAAFSLFAMINLVTSTLAEAVLPKVSSEATREYYLQLLRRIWRTSPFVLSIAGILGVALYFLFYYGFGGKYVESLNCMVFIGCGMIFLFYMHTINTIFYPLKRTDLVFKIILAMFVVNVSMGYLMIPVWASVGAAVTNMVVSFVGLVLTIIALKRLLNVSWKA